MSRTSWPTDAQPVAATRPALTTRTLKGELTINYRASDDVGRDCDEGHLCDTSVNSGTRMKVRVFAVKEEFEQAKTVPTPRCQLTFGTSQGVFLYWCDFAGDHS